MILSTKRPLNHIHNYTAYKYVQHINLKPQKSKGVFLRINTFLIFTGDELEATACYSTKEALIGTVNWDISNI